MLGGYTDTPTHMCVLFVEALLANGGVTIYVGWVYALVSSSPGHIDVNGILSAELY